MGDSDVPFAPARDTAQAHLEPEIRDGSQSPGGGHVHRVIEDRNISCTQYTTDTPLPVPCSVQAQAA